MNAHQSLRSLTDEQLRERLRAYAQTSERPPVPPATLMARSRRKRTHMVLGAAAAVVILVSSGLILRTVLGVPDGPPAATSSTAPDTANSTAPDPELPHVLVMTQTPDSWGSEVLHPGSLVIDDAGCLALHSNVDDRVNGLLFPPGTTVQMIDSTARVTLPTGQAMDVGDRVTGSGHYRSADIANLLPTDSPCPTYPAYTGPGQVEGSGTSEP